MATVAIRGLRTLLTFMALGFCGACSNEPKETEQPVPVQIVPVSKATLQQTVMASAVLFPIAQSALVPKISAPVKKFYVNRGSHVRAGQLLAELENRDLAAAAQENRGAYDQAQPTSRRNCRKRNWTPKLRSRPTTPRRRYTTAGKSCSSKAPCRARNWIRPA